MRGKKYRIGKRAAAFFLAMAILTGSFGADISAAAVNAGYTKEIVSTEEAVEQLKADENTNENAGRELGEGTDKESDKKPGMELDEETEKEPGGELNKETDEEPGGESDKETDREPGEESDKETDKEPGEGSDKELDAELQLTAVVENLSAAFDCEEFTAGQVITATLTPEEGYVVLAESIVVRDAEGTELELEIQGPDEAGAVAVSFEAAESDMELAASARHIRNVRITCLDELKEPSARLSAEVSPEVLYEGAEVTVSVTNTGDKLWEADIASASGEVEFVVKGDSLSFSMPDEDVELVLYEREAIDYGNLSGEDLSINGDWQGNTSSTKKDNEPDVELGKSARWTDIEDGYAELTITEKDTSDYSNTPVDYIIILDRTRTMSLNESTWEGGGQSVKFQNSNSPCINPQHFYMRGDVRLKLVDHRTGYALHSGHWFSDLPSSPKFWNNHYNSSEQSISPVYGNGCQDRLTMAKQGIGELLTRIEQQNKDIPASKNRSRVAFWSFAGPYIASGDKRDQGLYNYVGLTENYNQVKNAVNAVQTYSGTYYKESLKEAYRIISQRNASDSRHKDVYTKVIFISDGMCGDDNLNEVKALAGQVKSLPNTELFTLAVGMTPDSEGTRFLRELATSSAHTASFWQNLSFSGGGGSAFAETLFNIDKKGGEVRAVSKVLTDQIETDYWEPVEVLSATGGIQNVSLNKNTGRLVWNIPEGAGKTYSCTVKLKLKDAYRFLLSDALYPTNRDTPGATPGDIQNTPGKAGAVVTYRIKGGIYNEEGRETGVITPKLKYGTVHFTGEKHWTVSGSRPDSITVRLMRTLPGQSRSLQVNNAVTNGSKNWRYEFTYRLMPDGSKKPLIKYDENGRAVRYEVTESVPQFYCQLDSVVSQKASGTDGGVVIDTQLYNEPFKVKARIRKVDRETGNPLSGAVFSVYAWSEKRKDYVPYLGTTDAGAKPHETGTMEGAGTGMTLSQGSRGTYTTPSWLYYSRDNQGRFRIIETRAPEGYFGDWKDASGVTDSSTDADKNVYDFAISPDGAENKSTVEVSNQADGTFGDTRVLGRLAFSKKDLERGETLPQGDASLAGAAYRLYAAENILHQDGTTGVLYAKDAEVKVRFVSSGDGIRTYRYDTGGTAVMKTAAGAELAVEGLEIGRYYLKEETAGEGYLVDPKTYPFEIAYQGEKKAVVEITDYSVYEQVKKQAVSFYKVTGADNADKLEPMKGAKFSIYLLSDVADGKYMHLTDEELPQAVIDDYRNTQTLGYEAFRSVRPAVIYEEKDSPDVSSGRLVKKVQYSDGTEYLADSGNENAYLAAEIEADEKGVVTTPRLPYGRYLIIETTVPKNAVATRPIAVTITGDDEDAVIDGDGKGEERSDLEILMDRPIMSLVRIVKYDTFRNKPVLEEGAAYVIHDVEGAWFDYYTREMTTAQKAAYKLKYGDLVVQYSQGAWTGTKDRPFTTKHVEGETDETCNVYIETPAKLPSGIYELEELKAPEGYILQGKEGVIAKDTKETSAENHTLYERESDGMWTAAPKGRARFVVSSSEAHYDEGVGAFVVLARQSNDPAVGKISIYAEGEQLTSAKQEGSTILNRLGDVIESFFGYLAGIFVKTEDEEGISEKELTSYRDYVFQYEMKPIEGAEFEIRAAEDIYSPEGGANAEKLYEKGGLVTTLSTDTAGKTWTGQKDKEGTDIPEGLPLGKYTVTQTAAGEGFALSEENAVPREIEIAYAGQEIPVIYRDTAYTNPRQKVRISIAKQDAQNEQALAGAVFGLYAAEDIEGYQGKRILKADTLIATAETTLAGNGEIKEAVFAPDLPHARYYVKELSAPVGYMLNDEPIEIDASYNKRDQSALAAFSGVIKNDPAQILAAMVSVDESTIALTQAGDIYKSTVNVVKNNTEYPLEHFTLTDSLSDQVWPTELWTGTYNQELTYSVEYQTNKDEDWVLWAEDLDTKTNHHLTVPEELAGEGEHIQAFRMRYGTVDGGFSREEAPAYMVKSHAGAKGSIPNEIEVTGMQAGVVHRDEAAVLTKLYSKSVNSYPAETEEEPGYEIVDTVGPEEEGKRIEEIVKKVKEQEANPPKPESVQRVKVVENPQADDGSALLRMLAPRTGDRAEILLWVLLMSCAAAGIAGGFIRNRRKRNKREDS